VYLSARGTWTPRPQDKILATIGDWEQGEVCRESCVKIYAFITSRHDDKPIMAWDFKTFPIGEEGYIELLDHPSSEGAWSSRML
jgi:hypothetical protein